MLKLQWPLCTIWVCVITHTGSQLESNVNYLEILKYPAELPGYDFNKNPLVLCNNNESASDSQVLAAEAVTNGYNGQENEDDDNNGDDDDDDVFGDAGKVKTNSTIDNRLQQQFSAFLLKIFTNIAQQIPVQQSSCGKSKSSTRMSTTAAAIEASAPTAAMTGSTMQPLAKTMATSKRSLRVYYEGQQPPQAQGMGSSSFNIWEQLKLDEKEQHKLQLQSQQEQQHGHSQELTGLPQDIWDESTLEQLAKASKRKRRKRKRKRKKKKKPPKDKDKNKNKRKKKRKQQPSLVAQPAHVLFASPHLPQHHATHTQHVALPTPQLPLTTRKPQHHFTPIRKIKYILRKNTILKKKKKEYLNHLKQVLYPFVKFIAFFTVLNPFTLAVFLFSLVSPVVFGFIGFIGLSFLIKPALGLLFGVKRTVSSLNRKRQLEKRRRERLRNSRRPITIHKHYYQQHRISPPHRHRQHQRHRHRSRLLRPSHKLRHAPRQPKQFNPLLPHVKQKLKKDTSLFIPNFVRYKRDNKR